LASAIAASAAFSALAALLSASAAASVAAAAARLAKWHCVAVCPRLKQTMHSRKSNESKLKHIHDKMLIRFLI